MTPLEILFSLQTEVQYIQALHVIGAFDRFYLIHKTSTCTVPTHIIIITLPTSKPEVTAWRRKWLEYKSFHGASKLLLKTLVGVTSW